MVVYGFDYVPSYLLEEIVYGFDGFHGYVEEIMNGFDGFHGFRCGYH